MMKSAKTANPRNSKTMQKSKTTPHSLPNHQIRPLLFHTALALIISCASYGLVDHLVTKQKDQALITFGQQASAVVNRQVETWHLEGELLAQQPTLKSIGTVKAIIPANAAAPASLSFSDQDLLNRAQSASAEVEVSRIGSQAKVTIASAIPEGGFLISERSFSVLANDLKRITPPNMLLRLTQKVGSEQPVEILKTSNPTDAPLTPVPIKTKGWQLSVGQVNVSSSNPADNLPLLAALLTLMSGLLPLLIWMSQKPRLLRVESTTVDSEEEQLRKINDVAKELTPSPQVSPVIGSEPQPLTPIPNQYSQIEALKKQDSVDNTALRSTSPQALDTGLEKPLPETTLELPKTHATEFTLDNTALTELEFFITKSIPKHIFRAYDIRGKVSDLTAQWMLPMSRALGAEFRTRGQIEVVVGYDARTASEEYARIMREALVDSGIQVIDIGQVPTPVMHYAARQHQGNGIMITASHSPADYNGIKWITQRQSPLPEDIQNIYDRAEQRKFTEGQGKISKKSYTQDYLNEILADVMLSDDVSVMIDGLNGVMGKPALQAIEMLGCHVTGLDIEPNGSYPHGNPDPCEPNRLNNLSTQIIQSGANIGFAFDGDGDRLVVVNQDGTVITSDQLIALFAIMVLESKPGTDIVYDVKCSRMVSQTITAHGGRPIMSRSGSTFIRHAVMSKRNEVSFGGEFSGHYFFNDGRGSATDDGLYAAMRLLEWLTQRGQTLSDILATLPHRTGTPDIYLPLDSDLPEKFFQELAINAALIEHATLTTIDGVRLDFQDGFGIIRASNTGAFVTLRFEADTEASVQNIRQIFYDLIAKQLPNLAATMPNVTLI